MSDVSVTPHTHDLPSPEELNRLAVLGTTADEADHGRILAVGVEYPSGHVLATLTVHSAPVTYANTDDLRRTAATLSETHTADVWVEYAEIRS